MYICKFFDFIYKLNKYLMMFFIARMIGHMTAVVTPWYIYYRHVKIMEESAPPLDGMISTLVKYYFQVV